MERPAGSSPDPFCLPSDTDLRFALLLIIAFASSTFMFSWIYSTKWVHGADYAASVKQCVQILRRPIADSGVDEVARLKMLVAHGSGYGRCMSKPEGARGLWIALALCGMFTGTLAAYWLRPGWIIWRRTLQPVSPAEHPELSVALDALVREANVAAPRFLIDPVDSSRTGAVAFGRAGRRWVKLGARFITSMRRDPEFFRAGVLHELAHIRNADLDKSSLTASLLASFGATALLPFIIITPLTGSEDLFAAFWRAGALALLLAWAAAGVLRARELFADARLRQWGAAEAFHRVMRAFRPHRRLERLWPVHPSPDVRARVLSQPSLLFRTPAWMPFIAGLASAVVYKDIFLFLAAFTQGRPIAEHQFILGALIVLPIGMGVVGVGIWRSMLLDSDRSQSGNHALATAALFVLGMILGEHLSMLGMLSSHDVSWTELVLWNCAVLALVYAHQQWIRTSASLCLAETRDESSQLRWTCFATVAAGSLSLAYWFGVFQGVRLFSARSTSAFDFVLTTIGFTYPRILSPVTSAILFILFTCPFAISQLAALRRRRRTTQATPHGRMEHPITRLAALCRHPLAATAWKAAAIFLLALIALHTVVRVWTPAALKASPDFLISFFALRVGIAAILQGAVAVRVARLKRQAPKLTGLAVSFGASALMSVVLWAVGYLFTRVSPLDLGFVFTHVANVGTLVALSALLAMEIWCMIRAATSGPGTRRPTLAQGAPDVTSNA